MNAHVHEFVRLVDFFSKESTVEAVDAQQPQGNGEMEREAQHVSYHARVLASVLIEALQCHEPRIIATWIRHRLTTVNRPNSQAQNGVDLRELQAQLADVQRVREVGQKQPFRKSKLDRYRPQILLLHATGASFRDIQVWLRRYRRLRVSPSTIFRVIQRWKDE